MQKFPTQLSEDIAAKPRPKRFFHFWRCFWLAFLFASLPYAWYCFYAPYNRIHWAQNFADAELKAEQNGKPMILFFTGHWCVPCRIMKRNVWADEQVTASVNSAYIPVEFYVDDPNSEAAMLRYNVGSTPTTIVTDPNGKLLDQRHGGLSKTEFLDMLNALNSPAGRDG